MEKAAPASPSPTHHRSTEHLQGQVLSEPELAAKAGNPTLAHDDQTLYPRYRVAYSHTAGESLKAYTV